MFIGKDLSHSLFFKFVLFVVLGASLVVLALLRYNSSGQLKVIMLVGSFYSLWGILFHLHKRNITWQTIGEYLVIGLMIVVVGFVLTGGR